MGRNMFVMLANILYVLSDILNTIGKRFSPISDPYVGEVPVREDTYPGPSALWPVPFLAASISPVFPPGPHSILGGDIHCSNLSDNREG